MISEFFINIIFTIVYGLLGLVPDVTVSVDSSAFTYFLGIIDVGCYLLPMTTVHTILVLIIALGVFKIGIAVIKTIWDLLPLV